MKIFLLICFLWNSHTRLPLEDASVYSFTTTCDFDAKVAAAAHGYDPVWDFTGWEEHKSGLLGEWRNDTHVAYFCGCAPQKASK